MSMTPPVSDRLRIAFVRLSENAVPSADCPNPEEIWRAVSGTMEGPAVARIAAHTAGCFACAESWRIGRELCGPPVARMKLAAPHGMKTWLAMAAAAALIILSGAALYLLPEGGRPSLAERGGQRGMIRSLVPPETALPRGSFLLRWEMPGQVASWSLEVGTEDLSSVASVQGLAAPEYLVAEKLLERLPSGAWVIWRVEAELPGGHRVASSTFRTRIQ